jgi:hypothetical protein
VGDSSAHDFTQATNTGTWTSADLTTNGNDFTQATGPNQPGISGTLGATFESAGQFIARSLASGTYTIILALRKDDADSTGFIVDDNAESDGLRYGDGGGGHQIGL